MNERVVVAGAGGFGRKVLDALEAVNAANLQPRYQILGVVDDQPSEMSLERLRQRGIAYLGTIDAWLSDPADAGFVAALGFPSVRRRVVEKFAALGIPAVSVIDPRAGLGSQVEIGRGTVVLAGVQISTNVSVGDHVHLNANATIGHDVIIGDFVSANPGAIVSGDCLVKEGVLLGAGSVTLQGLSLGEFSVVGAAACVVADVPPGVTVKGVPAR